MMWCVVVTTFVASPRRYALILRRTQVTIMRETTLENDGDCRILEYLSVLQFCA
jgi:hypothetical protein